MDEFSYRPRQDGIPGFAIVRDGEKPMAIVCRNGRTDEETEKNAKKIIRALNSNVALLECAQQFAETVEYYIKIDESDGDKESANMKRVTLALVRSAISRAEAAC